MPDDHKPPTPAEQLEDQRRRLLAQAEAGDWGPLSGVVVLGSEIVYTFAGGQQIVMGMPDGFKGSY